MGVPCKPISPAACTNIDVFFHGVAHVITAFTLSCSFPLSGQGAANLSVAARQSTVVISRQGGWVAHPLAGGHSLKPLNRPVARRARHTAVSATFSLMERARSHLVAGSSGVHANISCPDHRLCNRCRPRTFSRKRETSPSFLRSRGR